MDSYKIKVNNEAESKEVEVGLDFLLGGANICRNYGVYDTYPRFVFGNSEFVNTYAMVNFDKISNKEITLPQLRDLVVLKRNDVGDATHIANFKCDEPFFVSSNNEVYIWWGESHWEKSGIKLKELKPIEKIMKEYLNKSTGEYKKTDGVVSGDNWEQIPVEWANFVYKRKSNNQLFFSDVEKSDDDLIFLWKRQTQTTTENDYLLQGKNGEHLKESIGELKQPEELPFIDDEPKLDTPMAYMEREFERDQCMENARREGLLGDPRIGAPHNPYDEPFLTPELVAFETITEHQLDATAAFMGFRKRLGGETDDVYRELVRNFGKTQSLNDQYAEIEKVRQSKPHNHYFIDVSDVDDVDFYEIALRYNVTDPCIQHILKKCLAVGNRGHKDFQTDIRDIYDTAKRAIKIHGLD